MAAGLALKPLLRYFRTRPASIISVLRNGRPSRRALEESERRFRAIVEDQTDMICRLDAGLRITFSNRAHARFSGGQPEDLEGQDFLAAFPNSLHAFLLDGLRSLTAGEPMLRFEHERTLDGEVRWFAWTCRALFNGDGDSHGYQAVGRDITARKRAERALKESETRFRAIVEDQTEFISRCSPDYRITFINRAYARQLGRPRELIIGTSVLDLMTPAQQKQFVRQLEGLTPSTPTVSYEMAAVTPDGRQVWEQWTDRALFDEAGRLVEYQSVGRDITPAKEVEETLKASAEELALIADCIPVAMLISRGDPMEILFSNTQARDSYGIHPGCTAAEISAVYEDPRDRRVLLERIAREGSVDGFDLSLRRRDGAVVRTLVSAKSIQFRGSPAVVAAITDITTRQEIEQALRTSEARLQAFMQYAPAGMYLKDLRGRYVVANPEMEKVQNRPVAQIIGRTPEDVFEPELAATIRGYDKQVLETGASVINEEYVPYMPHYTWRMVIRFPIRDVEGAITHIAGFIFDITARKLAEAEADRQRAAMHQRDKLAALGSLLAGVAHELNNPLSVVLGRAIMLEEKCEEPAMRNSLGRLRTAAERCARIVKSFLALARQKPRETRPVEVPKVLDASMEILASGLRSAGIEVFREDAPDLPMVMADEDELHQVFLNLVINAQQALEEAVLRSPAGFATAGSDSGGSGRRLWIRTAVGGQGDFVRIEVADNGPGVPPALRGQIFDPFFTTKPLGAGTGLGLSVCHGIVAGARRHHRGGRATGRRRAVSRDAPGGCKRPGDRPGGPPAGFPGAVRPVGDVLVVDDEPMRSSRCWRRSLTRDGYRVVVRRRRRGRPRTLARRLFDVVLCDIRMPRLDGPGLLQALETARPDLAGRVLLMTGDVLRAAATLPREVCGRLLEKPLDPAEVRRRVGEMVGRDQ